MPRRQRFKPSRKPKPAIEPSDSTIGEKPANEREREMQEQQIRDQPADRSLDEAEST